MIQITLRFALAYITVAPEQDRSTKYGNLEARDSSRVSELLKQILTVFRAKRY